MHEDTVIRVALRGLAVVALIVGTMTPALSAAAMHGQHAAAMASGTGGDCCIDEPESADPCVTVCVIGCSLTVDAPDIVVAPQHTRWALDDRRATGIGPPPPSTPPRA